MTEETSQRTARLSSGGLMEADLYEILGVKPDAKPIELKRMFRTKQREAHPDRKKTTSDRNAAIDLNRAYQILSNPITRLEYDIEHGFKEKTEENLRKLYDYKRKKAQTERENMINTAIQSRERESKVTATMPDGTVLANAGLIIAKATYGIMSLPLRLGEVDHGGSTPYKRHQSVDMGIVSDHDPPPPSLTNGGANR
ncbi:chaperone protein DnaJ [Reticulomyxa filosa]|uniref:Chaperone protein DnaJ n=1 Tax=Reticulomyxa filosa TaxID=46433 RepID=X6NFD5_RETFI|nr:chaperone protein DnaJ [Reticulomyxa filosa]|eukprot:ETO24618.1 chaperone protein DnaJ [Reticulomyxa filosa]